VRTVTVTDLRILMPEVLRRVKTGRLDAQPVIIKRHREPLAALISMEQYQQYRALLTAHPAVDD
jgi:prevent-host-death family protein